MTDPSPSPEPVPDPPLSPAAELSDIVDQVERMDPAELRAQLAGAGVLFIPAEAAEPVPERTRAQELALEAAAEIQRLLDSMTALQQPKQATVPRIVGHRAAIDWDKVDMRTPSERACQAFQRPEHQQGRFTEFTDLGGRTLRVSASTNAMVAAVRLFMPVAEYDLERFQRETGLSRTHLLEILSGSTGVELCRAMAVEVRDALNEFLADPVSWSLACDLRQPPRPRTGRWARLRERWHGRRRARAEARLKNQMNRAKIGQSEDSRI